MVEPDQILARTCKRALEKAGHTVALAASAQAAVHFADRQKPDMVLLEMELPRHNGVEFLYEFRSYDEWLDVPVMVHSFVPPAELTGAATLQQELGVVQILYKPATSLAQLCSAVERVAAV